MAPNGSRRLVACGPVPHTRSRRRNTRLGTPSKAWLTALCVLLFALPVSAASEARQTDDCASRVASALAPVPPEDVTPAMRAGLVEACEGVVAALAAAPAAAGVDQALLLEARARVVELQSLGEDPSNSKLLQIVDYLSNLFQLVFTVFRFSKLFLRKRGFQNVKTLNCLVCRSCGIIRI